MKSQSRYKIEDQFGTYFLTFTIVGWVDVFARKELRDIIINSFKYCQENKELKLNAYVIMSNHIHIIASTKTESEGLSVFIRDFKKFTSKAIVKFVQDSYKESRRDWLDVVFKYHAKYNKNNKDYKIWQSSNCPKILLHPKFTMQKLSYIHNNPVVAGIVNKPEDYVYSSASTYRGDEGLIDIEIIDFGVQEGYVFS